MEYAAGVAVVKSIGVETTLKCISALTSTTKGIYGFVRSIGACVEAPEVRQFIERADIMCKTRQINALLADVDVNQHHTHTLETCIEDLQVCYTEIESLLGEMQERINYNSSIWVGKSVRAYGFSDLYAKLETAARNLESRSSFLIKVLSINDKLKLSTNREPQDCSLIIL